MEVHSAQPKYWVKYSLHKDGSPMEDGFYERKDAEKHICALLKQGYSPKRKYLQK